MKKEPLVCDCCENTGFFSRLRKRIKSCFGLFRGKSKTSYKITLKSSYEAKLYLGQINSVTKEAFTEAELENFIGKIQEKSSIVIPVRLTKTKFVSETNYQESGWEVAAIQFPKVDCTDEQIYDFIMELGKELLIYFGQTRICVIDRDTVRMLEKA